MLIDKNRHVLCRQPIPQISRRPAHCEPFSPLFVSINLSRSALSIVNWRAYMYPVRGIFRVTLFLKAQAHLNLMTLARTCLDGVFEGNHPALSTIKFRCQVVQRFQLSPYPIYAAGHLNCIRLPGVEVLGIVMKSLSSSKSTQSSGLIFAFVSLEQVVLRLARDSTPFCSKLQDITRQ